MTLFGKRERVTASLLNVMFTSDFQLDPEAEKTPEEWIRQMSSDGFWADHYFIELCSEYQTRDIAIYPLHPNQAWKDGKMKIEQLSRRRLNQPVPTARKTPPLVVMERTGAQHWEEHVIDAAKKDI